MIAVKMASGTRGASQSHHPSGHHEKDGDSPPAASPGFSSSQRDGELQD